MQTLAPGIQNKADSAKADGRISLHLSYQRGFSLLELLVVIVIISILFTFTTLAIRGTSPEELIQTEAQRLDRLIQLALEEAILKGAEYGVEFKPDSYRFLLFFENRWQPLENDRLLRQRQLPENMEFELEIEQIEVLVEEETNDTEDADRPDPQVFILSSGEITPEFSVRLVMPGVATSYIVSGSINGEHRVEPGEL
jgi:general secretion pathway protein H